LHPGRTNGSQWANTVEVAKYSWAAIGLYRLVGTATNERGSPICTTTAYMCVDGKLAVLTVVGAVAALMALVAVFLLVRGLMMLRWRSRVRVAYRLGGAGLLGGIAVPLLLQQNCVVGLTRTIALASALGGLVGMTALGLAVGGRRARPRPPESTAALFTVPDRDQQRQHQTVYRFHPAEDACAACVEHAAHRLYRTEEAAAADRAHEGCTCPIESEVAQDPFLVSRFGDGDVIDDREG
jgi:hypothetical protein